jgi:energy-coupling factor transporter ATP-binding protein EcfA2
LPACLLLCRAQSLLVLGKPGTGKTTLLREIARLMSTPPEQGGLGLSVLIVDTSNEIAGNSDHPVTCLIFSSTHGVALGCNIPYVAHGLRKPCQWQLCPGPADGRRSANHVNNGCH